MIVMEYVKDGDLWGMLRKNPSCLNWNDHGITISIDICRGLSFLHSQNYVHRDLCSTNILILEFNGIYHAKISDVGLAKKLEAPVTPHTSNKVAIAWCAPEVIDTDSDSYVVTQKSDIWRLVVAN